MISDIASLLSVLHTLEAHIMIKITKCPILAYGLCEFQSPNSVLNQGKARYIGDFRTCFLDTHYLKPNSSCPNYFRSSSKRN